MSQPTWAKLLVRMAAVIAIVVVVVLIAPFVAPDREGYFVIGVSIFCICLVVGRELWVKRGTRESAKTGKR